MICEHCDSVYKRRDLAVGQIARCDCCSAVLYRASRLNVDRWLALTVATAIVFVIANVCPVIAISLKGLHSEVTLWQAAKALAQGAAAPIAVPMAITVIVVPFLQIVALLWVLIYARLGLRAPGFAKVMRLLAALHPWGMVEVCILGILVAVIKLSSMVHVAAGPGIWAAATLMVLITVIVNRDTHILWMLPAEKPSSEAGAVQI